MASVSSQYRQKLKEERPEEYVRYLKRERARIKKKRNEEKEKPQTRAQIIVQEEKKRQQRKRSLASYYKRKTKQEKQTQNVKDTPEPAATTLMPKRPKDMTEEERRAYNSSMHKRRRDARSPQKKTADKMKRRKRYHERKAQLSVFAAETPSSTSNPAARPRRPQKAYKLNPHLKMASLSTQYRQKLKEERPEDYVRYLERERARVKKRRDEEKRRLEEKPLTKAQIMKQERKKRLQRYRSLVSYYKRKAEQEKQAQSVKNTKQPVSTTWRAKRPKDMTEMERRAYNASMRKKQRDARSPQKKTAEKTMRRKRYHERKGQLSVFAAETPSPTSNSAARPRLPQKACNLKLHFEVKEEIPEDYVQYLEQEKARSENRMDEEKRSLEEEPQKKAQIMVQEEKKRQHRIRSLASYCKRKSKQEKQTQNVKDTPEPAATTLTPKRPKDMTEEERRAHNASMRKKQRDARSSQKKTAEKMKRRKQYQERKAQLTALAAQAPSPISNSAAN